ncbi:MAG: sulfatase-like hydrolase/transferase [Candidatus Lokiarchaeota archaeon]|nr:sulfatase-like hydrolase/transferase [Candidatus Lokiarchaeota archaeon]
MTDNYNVLFIITDQQRADHLGCYGNKILKTPNIDGLAKDGVRFTSAFCANPMCMPNRASIYTGTYPNVHGVRMNGINLPSNIPTLTQILTKNGYHTISIGKIHFQHYSPPRKRNKKSLECIMNWIDDKKRKELENNFPLPYYGFEEVELTIGHGDLVSGHYFSWLEEKAPNYLEYMRTRLNSWFLLMRNLFDDTQLPEEVYPTAYLKDKTISFLQDYAAGNYGDKPFFLQCSFPDPHHPATPPEKYKKLYEPSNMELPDNFHDIENLKNHPFLKHNLKLKEKGKSLFSLKTVDDVKKFMAYTYGTITNIDSGIGEILSTLNRTGLSENTIVIYTSDHGELMGEHGLTTKGPYPFKGILKVPLIWRVPGMAKNKVINSLVNSIDITKTLTNLLKIRDLQFKKQLQGCDLTPMLENPNQKIRNSCLIEEDEAGGFLTARVRHLITEKYKLTIYEGLRNHGDLYDRKNDPNEINNLWYNKNYREIREKLVKEMLHELLKVQSRYPEKQGDLI